MIILIKQQIVFLSFKSKATVINPVSIANNDINIRVKDSNKINYTFRSLI